MKTKFFALVLMIILILSVCCAAIAMQEIDWTALVEGSTTDTSVETTNDGAVIDWGVVFSDIMTGAVTALVIFICGTIAYAILRILIPLLPTLVQWLKDKNILWIAKILVTAAESALGRFVGSTKFAQVVAWFEKRHIKVTDEVKQMIYNAWWQLNKQMIELGLKEAAIEEDNAAEDGGGAEDPFTGTEEPVRMG